MKSKAHTFIDSITQAAELKDLIPFEKVHKYLPFPTTFGEGSSRTHLQYESIYPLYLENKGKTLNDGDTLCSRTAWPGLRRTITPHLTTYPACPGCLNIARGLAVKALSE